MTRGNVANTVRRYCLGMTTGDVANAVRRYGGRIATGFALAMTTGETRFPRPGTGLEMTSWEEG